MKPKFTVTARISKPVHDVFEAVVDPDSLSQYFTTGGAKGRLAPGATVWWEFADFPGSFPVDVIAVDQDRQIVLRWDADNDSKTTITMSFESLEGARTLVQISEEGWDDTEDSLQASYGNCEGWTNALCCMKAWHEYGIRLREGFYK